MELDRLRFSRALRALDRVTWMALVAGFAVAFSSGAIIALLVKHTGGWTTGTSWDLATLWAVHTSLPRWLDALLDTLPWLGTNITIFIILVPASVWLTRRGRSDIAAEVGVAAVGSYLLALMLKFVFERPRPSLWPRRGEYSWASYPSGHAIAMVSVLLLVACLVYRERRYTWPCLVWVPLFIGTLYSRVYLGVHWPSDVVSGVVVGVIWFMTVVLAFRRANRIRKPIA